MILLIGVIVVKNKNHCNYNNQENHSSDKNYQTGASVPKGSWDISNQGASPFGTTCACS
jgi:hypothetical protein